MAMDMDKTRLGHRSGQESLSKRYKELPRQTPGSWPVRSSPYSISSSTINSLDTSSSVARPQSRPSQVPESPPTPPTSHALFGPERLKTPPIIQKSPPTPEDTPPRHAATLGIPLRHALSATDSFMTAREDQWSADEDTPRGTAGGIAGGIAGGNTGRAEVQNNTYKKAYGNHVGLGLGLESDGESAPSPSKVYVQKPSAAGETINLYENWGEDLGNSAQEIHIRPYQLSGNETKEDHVRQDRAQEYSMWEMNGGTERGPKRSKKRQRLNAVSNPVIDDGLEQSIARSLERSGSKNVGNPTKHQNGTNGISQYASNDSVRSSEKDFQWPIQINSKEESREEFENTKGMTPSKVLEHDHKRFSTSSNTSTIIREALVMDLAPPKQQSLRHTGRNLAFRDTRFNTTDSTNDVESHKLIHRSRKLTNQDRRSISSEITEDRGTSRDATGKTLSGSWPRRNSQTSTDTEIIPVVIIPQRQSSLKRTGSEGHNPKRSGSLSSRPGTGNLHLEQRRTASDSHSIRPIEIPVRSSSLSAPTSRIGSRAESFATASIHSRPVSVRETEDKYSAFGLQPPNILPLRSPFSAPSTPEALEVRQARAVNFYPHTNHSVNLVIQSNSQSGNDPESTDLTGTTPQIATIKASTSQLSVIKHTDSPLRNPRKPPDPPHLMVIPPTPANDRSPVIEQFRQETPRRTQSVHESVSKVRRALSQRRSSVSESIGRFSSLSRRYRPPVAPIRRPSRVTEKKTTSLHPFWRPRGFWEGFENEREGKLAIDEDFLDRGWSPWLENSVGAQQRFSFVQPESVPGLNKGVKPRKLRWSRIHSSTRDRLSRSSTNRKGWTSVHQRLKRARLQQKERATERERSKLRQSIGGPVLFESSNPGFPPPAAPIYMT